MSRKRLLFLITTASILGLSTSCQKGAGTATSSSSAPSNYSAGCGLTPTQTGTFHVATVDGNGTARDFEVMVPTNYNPATPLKLSLVYHGANNTEAGAVAFGLQNAPGALASGIFLFPQGINFETYGVGWNDLCTGYDMVFFDNMVSYIESHYCVDKTRVFAAGFSWGCDHVTALTCCRGNVIKAVGAASCSDEFNNEGNYLTYQNPVCVANTNVGIRFTHDVASDGAYTAQEFSTTSQLYRNFNSCAGTSVATSPSPCVSYNSCSSPVVECGYTGLGHAIPANWGNDTWSFFSSF